MIAIALQEPCHTRTPKTSINSHTVKYASRSTVCDVLVNRPWDAGWASNNEAGPACSSFEELVGFQGLCVVQDL